VVGKTYLTKLPQRVPEGNALVHNRIRPRTQLNAHGVRAWLQARVEYLELCTCGWAPHLGEHYKDGEICIVCPRRSLDYRTLQPHEICVPLPASVEDCSSLSLRPLGREIAA
jgi:hypothetical protein